MSWDDEDWDAPAKDEAEETPAAALTDKWDGEDEDDDCLLGDDWDADPEEKKKEEAKKVVPGAKKLTKRQLAKKKEAEEKAAAMARMKSQQQAKDDPDAAAKERAAVKKEIEKSNLGLTMDLFGGEGYEAPENGEFHNEQLDQDNTDMMAEVNVEELRKLKVSQETPIESEELKTLDDYKKFGVKVAGITSKAAKQKMVVEFAKALLQECTKKMKLDEATEIKKAINVICNQKQKDEANKKKKVSKKAQLNMRNDDPFGGDEGGYDDMMDDFL